MSNLFNYKNDYKKRNGRLFYEIWGDLEAQNTTLKIIIVLMSLITSTSLLTAFYTYKANRIPVVIRVNSAGNAKVLRNLPFNNKTGMGEIVYFSKSFVREFTGFNSIMIKTELSRALNKMSETYGKKTLRAIIRSRFIQKMEKADITSKIKFKKIKLIKQTVNHDELKLYVIRTVISNTDTSAKNAAAYEDKLILKRIKRSVQYPFGLEIVYFSSLKLGGA
ncbi:MAG: hypothetical protein EVJ48_05080 [Candidatus Acidulodesulfobacterium acidiphilum]|jgi:hypothetical protein|uniref:Bacterial virulence protein VirB8 domain-containing protein n=1 Tax=Candidatus Acidulodesulfobacterium acidiphilum TaxID=2597224 RepID=A0A520XDT7_9DELT|nr:MAG: hypothetical protein EVJ48_05080 [Candidatus Acidulodesulfobacterium acidiphilum]